MPHCSKSIEPGGLLALGCILAMSHCPNSWAAWIQGVTTEALVFILNKLRMLLMPVCGDVAWGVKAWALQMCCAANSWCMLMHECFERPKGTCDNAYIVLGLRRRVETCCF